MTFTIPAVAILALAISALPAAAADDTTITPSIDWTDTFRPSPIVWKNTTWGDDKVSRPPALAALYVSYAALQAYDVDSTTRALGRGGREANPLMQAVVGNTPGFIAVKAVAGIATVIGTERLWPKHKAAAIVDMLYVNSGGRSGLDILRFIREDLRLRQLPVIVLTGFPLNHDVVAQIESQHAELWHKPIDVAHLTMRLDEVLHAQIAHT